jgi:quinol monooxygenase YgiN
MSHPVNRLVIYRPKPGMLEALTAIVRQHGPVLRKTGLITDEPVRVHLATDLARGGAAAPPTYLVETFQWRDESASDTAHQTPEVMAVWETMGPLLEGMTLSTLEPLSS